MKTRQANGNLERAALLNSMNLEKSHAAFALLHKE